MALGRQSGAASKAIVISDRTLNCSLGFTTYLSRCHFLPCHLGTIVFAGSQGCRGVKWVKDLVRYDVLYA